MNMPGGIHVEMPRGSGNISKSVELTKRRLKIADALHIAYIR